MAVVTESAGSGEKISWYSVDDNQLPEGSTLGSAKAVAVIKPTGAIEKFYSIDAGAQLIGTLVLHHWDERSGVRLQANSGRFIIHPERQEHVFGLTNGLQVSETILVLNGAPQGDEVDPPAAYYIVDLYNASSERLEIATYAAAQLRGATSHDVVTAYSKKHRAFVVWNKSDPKVVRMFGASSAPASYEVSCDNAKSSATTFPGRLANEALPPASDPIGILHFSHALAPGAHAAFHLLVSCSVDGRAAAERTHAACPTAAKALRRTRAHYEDILARAVVVTPDAEVNRGVMWAKANMLRTEVLSPTGWSFVNDPTRSNNSVGRDTAWFAFGSDYVTPEFSRESLLWYATHLEKNGMVVEYYDIRNGKTADYGLNINDNTPLLILALWHHYNTSADLTFLKRVYRYALKAARYILSQRDERGLVWCTASGTANWGIVGWRNVIRNYRLSGATTEVNSECYAALMTIAHMARALKKHADAAEFKAHAERLKDAINEHLYNPDNGLYYLNIDLDGTPRTDVTSDLVFPVMFGVADDERASRIIGRLSVPEFWTDAGMHVVPRNDINYGPTHGYGLLGGVWVGATFWYAFAAARFNTEFMAYALRASFRHYSRDPLRNNTVPGQFSEWLHGETLANQGMMLSPWFPPRYLWAAIEGAAGLDLSGAEPSVTPRLASHWKWLGVRNIRLAGAIASWFVVRMPDLKMYGTFRFEHSMPYEFYDADVSAELDIADAAVTGIALRRGENFVLFFGSTSERTVTTGVRFGGLTGGTFAVSRYDSMRGSWVEGARSDAASFATGAALEFERLGFCVVECRRDT